MFNHWGGGGILLDNGRYCNTIPLALSFVRCLILLIQRCSISLLEDSRVCSSENFF